VSREPASDELPNEIRGAGAGCYDSGVPASDELPNEIRGAGAGCYDSGVPASDELPNEISGAGAGRYDSGVRASDESPRTKRITPSSGPSGITRVSTPSKNPLRTSTAR